jgi:hypothetical protein
LLSSSGSRVVSSFGGSRIVGTLGSSIFHSVSLGGGGGSRSTYSTMADCYGMPPYGMFLVKPTTNEQISYSCLFEKMYWFNFDELFPPISCF